MTHETAVQIQAPARYAIGDLAPGEQEQFEEHYADCSVCMNDVWAASALAANAKAVFSDRHKGSAVPKAERWPWLWMMPVPAVSWAFNGVLVASLGYLLLGVVPGYRAQLAQDDAPEVAQLVQARATVRGAGAEPVVAKGRSVVISFDLPLAYPKYRLVVTTVGGSVVRANEVTVAPGAADLSLEVPVSRLAPGNYQMMLAGLNGDQWKEIGSRIISVPAR